MAPVDYFAGSRKLGCVPEVFLGSHTTVRACASRYLNFLYIENQPTPHAFLFGLFSFVRAPSAHKTKVGACRRQNFLAVLALKGRPQPLPQLTILI